MKDETRPQFFIVGAPKSGTTALYHFLRQHPDIFMPSLKEPHYFATDISYRGYVKDREAYYRLFEGARKGALTGEASVWYLYSRVAARNIRKELGSSKILMLFRNPVDLLSSLHSQALESGLEDIQDFLAALDAEEDRRNGFRIPRTDYDSKLLFYSRIIDFTDQIERYKTEFGQDSLHIMLQEDLIRRPAETYRDCLNFLGVEPSFQPIFERVNANRSLRSFFLQRFVRSPHPTIRKLARRCLPASIRASAYRMLLRLNSFEQPRTPLSMHDRDLLTDRFQLQIRHLAQATGLDLSHWNH